MNWAIKSKYDCHKRQRRGALFSELPVLVPGTRYRVFLFRTCVIYSRTSTTGNKNVNRRDSDARQQCLEYWTDNNTEKWRHDGRSGGAWWLLPTDFNRRSKADAALILYNINRWAKISNKEIFGIPLSRPRKLVLGQSYINLYIGNWLAEFNLSNITSLLSILKSILLG